MVPVALVGNKREPYKTPISVNTFKLNYTEQNHERNTFYFCPHFSRAELKDLTLFLCTQKAYFSEILFTNLSKSVLVNEIIHPPHRCVISRC